MEDVFLFADQKDIDEYITISKEIDTLTVDDLESLKKLLKKRAKVMSRLLGAVIFPVKKRTV